MTNYSVGRRRVLPFHAVVQVERHVPVLHPTQRVRPSDRPALHHPVQRYHHAAHELVLDVEHSNLGRHRLAARVRHAHDQLVQRGDPGKIEVFLERGFRPARRLRRSLLVRDVYVHLGRHAFAAHASLVHRADARLLKVGAFDDFDVEGADGDARVVGGDGSDRGVSRVGLVGM